MNSKQILLGLTLLPVLWIAAGCGEEFPTQPHAVTISFAGTWPDTLDVTDTATFEVEVIDEAGKRLTGVEVDWQSSDSSVFTISQSQPAAGAGRSDSLTTGLRALVTARRSGSARVVVTVIHPGVDHAEARTLVTVRRWTLAEAMDWPQVLTVTETTTVQVAIANTDTAIASELRVQWQSSDEAVLRVTRAIPSVDPKAAELLEAKRTADLTALRTGSAEILVTVERPGFEPSEYRAAISVEALMVELVDTLPDTLMVGDSTLLVIALKDSRGDILPGRHIDWLSSDDAVLTVEERTPASAIVRATGRSSATVLAIVHPDGFERSQFQDTVRVMERWTSVSGGASHTCAISAGGSAYCWGAGQNGALGNGRPTNSPAPGRVFTIGTLKFRSVSAGDENTCAVVVGEVAYCWGLGTLGRLGTGSQANEFTPRLVSGRAFRSVSAGQTTCGTSALSESFCWGSNSDLQLGTPIPGPETCGAVDCSLTPIAVRSAFGDTLYSLSIDGATFHTCAISHQASTNRAAYCWGSGTEDPSTQDTVYLLGDSTFQSRSPTQVARPSGSTQPLSFDSLSTGDEHTCGVTTSGSVYCWGRNNQGQLGTGLRLNRAKPTPAWTPIGIPFLTISAGDSHTCALAEGGVAYCWGANDYGQLGTDSMSTSDVLIPAPVLGGHQFLSLAAGDFHTCGVTITGAAYCWGRNTSGQLGTALGTTTCRVGGAPTDCALAPRRISEPID